MRELEQALGRTNDRLGHVEGRLAVHDIRLNAHDKQFDNARTEHARFPQMVVSVIALIISGLATLGSLFAAGVLGP